MIHSSLDVVGSHPERELFYFLKTCLPLNTNNPAVSSVDYRYKLWQSCREATMEKRLSINCLFYSSRWLLLRWLNWRAEIHLHRGVPTSFWLQFLHGDSLSGQCHVSWLTSMVSTFLGFCQPFLGLFTYYRYRSGSFFYKRMLWLYLYFADWAFVKRDCY